MAKSEIFINSTNAKWSVSKFRSIDHLESEDFMFCGLKWKFTMRRKGEVFFLAANKITPTKPVRPFTFQAFLEDGKGDLQYASKHLLNFSNKSERVPLAQFRVEHNEIPTADCSITVFFNLTPSAAIQNETERERKLEAETSSNDACLEDLSLDMKRLLGDGTQSDVILKCEDKTIPAHRLIVSARSEVFAAMLQRSDLLEKQSGIVEITDMDPSILDQLIQFIYSGKLSDLSMDAALQLYVAGVKYAIKPLKRRCSAFIEENLTEGNACDILVFADIHSDRDLKECVVAFIAQSELLQKDDMWLKFCEDHPKLANEVLNRAFKAKCVSK